MLSVWRNNMSYLLSQWFLWFHAVHMTQRHWWISYHYSVWAIKYSDIVHQLYLIDSKQSFLLRVFYMIKYYRISQVWEPTNTKNSINRASVTRKRGAMWKTQVHLHSNVWQTKTSMHLSVTKNVLFIRSECFCNTDEVLRLGPYTTRAFL